MGQPCTIQPTLAYRMLGIGLLCLAVFVTPLYGMEAKDCGFDDRLLEVNKTERSVWSRDEDKFYDWSANKVNGRITVPYRYMYPNRTKLYPSWYTVKAVESAFRYIEEHVGCVKFEEKNTDKKSILIHIKAETRCWNGINGLVVPIDRDIFLQMGRAPCDRGWDKDSIEYIDKPLYTCREWIHTWKGSYCNRPHHWPNSPWFNTFIHEVFHVFGIAHTMKRVDRDDYINVLYENIPNTTRARSQYEIDPLIPVPNIPYECNSIMHYQPKHWYGFNGTDIVVKDPRTCKFGKKGPTNNDWKVLKSKVCGS